MARARRTATLPRFALRNSRSEFRYALSFLNVSAYFWYSLTLSNFSSCFAVSFNLSNSFVKSVIFAWSATLSNLLISDVICSILCVVVAHWRTAWVPFSSVFIVSLILSKSDVRFAIFVE